MIDYDYLHSKHPLQNTSCTSTGHIYAWEKIGYIWINKKKVRLLADSVDILHSQSQCFHDPFTNSATQSGQARTFTSLTNQRLPAYLAASVAFFLLEL